MLPDLGDKAHPLARDGADDCLRRAAVADRLAGRVDARGYRGIRDDAAAPHAGDQIVAANDAFAVAQEVDEQIEHLRLKRDRSPAAVQLVALDVKQMFAKFKPHWRLRRAAECHRLAKKSCR